MEVCSPYELLPTESLRFELEQTRPPPIIQTQSITNTKVVKDNFISRELDEDTGRRILDYIYDEVSGSVTTKKKSRKKTNLSIGADGHKNSFYIPEATNKPTSSTTFFDRISDSLGLKTVSNVQKINMDVLKSNGVTLEVLIDECEVSITNLKQANILSTFQDLLELGFTPMDLTRNRLLFNCGTLKTLFNADHNTLIKYGVPIDVEHLIRGKILSSELQTLGFSFDNMINEKGIGRDQLKTLNFPLRDLMNLGFEKRHLKKLHITKEFALKSWPDGFGWNKETFDLLS
jgi:hypothetical protein